MHECKWNLACERDHKRLALKNRAYGEAGNRIVKNSSDDSEAQEISDRCFTIFKEKTRAGAESSVCDSRNRGPHSPTGGYRIKQNNSKKPEQKTAQQPKAF